MQDHGGLHIVRRSLSREADWYQGLRCSVLRQVTDPFAPLMFVWVGWNQSVCVSSSVHASAFCVC